jgi:NitT/TauT family transport system ATP-binding protein
VAASPEFPSAAAVIEIRGLLTFQTADTPVVALSDIDLSIERGEFVSSACPVAARRR